MTSSLHARTGLSGPWLQLGHFEAPCPQGPLAICIHFNKASPWQLGEGGLPRPEAVEKLLQLLQNHQSVPKEDLLELRFGARQDLHGVGGSRGNTYVAIALLFLAFLQAVRPSKAKPPVVWPLDEMGAVDPRNQGGLFSLLREQEVYPLVAAPYHVHLLPVGDVLVHVVRRGRPVKAYASREEAAGEVEA